MKKIFSELKNSSVVTVICLFSITLIFSIICTSSAISTSVYAETTNDGVVLNKTVSQEVDDDGNYEITLEAYTTGAVGEQIMPLDVILVLDKSGTMKDPFKVAGNNETKMEALHRSVNDFLLKLNENAKANHITHRVAIVTFSSGAQKVTEKGYVEIDGSNSVNEVINDVNEISAGGGTKPNEGMSLAENIFNNNSKKEVNSQALIMFTDDCPDMTDYKTDYSDQAISIANRLKGQNVKIYSVGIFNKANPDMITFEDATQTEGKYQPNLYVMGNRFLNYLSTNSPDALSLGMEFEKRGSVYYIKINKNYTWENKGYYMAANNADGLNAIFYDLSQNLVIAPISLDVNTQIRDYISEYFKLPNGFSAQDITLKVIPYASDNQWGNPVELEYNSTTDNVAKFTSGNTEYNLYVTYDAGVGSVIVNGFDFDNNIVAIDSSGNPTGNKLQISFDITRADHFIGGNDVPTNLSTSGVYSKNVIVEPFDEPDTQVELLYDFDIKNQIIYRGNHVELEKLLNIDTVNLGENKANAFVDINFYIYNSNDVEIGKITIPKGTSEVNVIESLNNILEAQDTEYRIQCVVTPRMQQRKIVLQNWILVRILLYMYYSQKFLAVNYG